MKRFLVLLLALLLLSGALAEGMIPAAEDAVLAAAVEAPLSEAEEALDAGEDALPADAAVEAVTEALEAPDVMSETSGAPTVLSVTKKTTLKVYLGTTYQIEVPGATPTAFSSNRRKVAAVDGTGRVTLNKAGTAKITVKLSKKKKIALTLKVIDPKAPTKVTIGEGKKGTLVVGTPFQLTASVEPDTASQAVKWKSSRQSVAAVDANGLVTPKKAGSAVITATAGKKKARFKVKVKKGEITELSVFWMKHLASVIKQFDGLKRDKHSGNYVTYRNKYLRFVEYVEGSYKSGIGYISVDNTDHYTLFGVHIGMTAEEAAALLKPYEGKGDYYKGDNWVTYSMFYPEDSWFTLSFADGKVSSMNLNCFTNM